MWKLATGEYCTRHGLPYSTVLSISRRSYTDRGCSWGEWEYRPQSTSTEGRDDPSPEKDNRWSTDPSTVTKSIRNGHIHYSFQGTRTVYIPWFVLPYPNPTTKGNNSPWAWVDSRLHSSISYFHRMSRDRRPAIWRTITINDDNMYSSLGECEFQGFHISLVAVAFWWYYEIGGKEILFLRSLQLDVSSAIQICQYFLCLIQLRLERLKINIIPPTFCAVRRTRQ